MVPVSPWDDGFISPVSVLNGCGGDELHLVEYEDLTPTSKRQKLIEKQAEGKLPFVYIYTYIYTCIF